MHSSYFINLLNLFYTSMVHLVIHNGVVMAVWIQHWNDDVIFATYLQHQYYNIAPILCQFCEKCQMRAMHCRTVIFPQCFHRAVKTINNDIVFVCCSWSTLQYYTTFVAYCELNLLSKVEATLRQHCNFDLVASTPLQDCVLVVWRFNLTTTLSQCCLLAAWIRNSFFCKHLHI